MERWEIVTLETMPLQFMIQTVSGEMIYIRSDYLVPAMMMAVKSHNEAIDLLEGLI